MAAQFQSLSLFLLLLLTFQEMMPSEATMCQAPSRFFKGVCINSKNCGTICEEDGFLSGECKRLKCVCTKDCNPSGGGGEEPPVQGGDGSGREPVEGPTEEGGVASKGALCFAPNKLFTGVCIRSKKCLVSCVTQSFLSGECKWFQCLCAKKCDPGEEGPGEEPALQIKTSLHL